MVKIVEFDASRVEADGSVLVRLENGLVLVALSERMREYAMPFDADALPALQRALDCRPDLFREVHRTVAPVVVVATGSFASSLTVEDRARLRRITLAHWQKYFAEYPTPAQLDQLIDSIGPGVAAAIVKRAVDLGTVH